MRRLTAEAERLALDLVSTHPAHDDFETVTMLAGPLSVRIAGRLVGLTEAQIEDFVTATGLLAKRPELSLYGAASSVLINLEGGVPMVDDLVRSGDFTERQAAAFVQLFWIASALSSRLALPNAILVLLENPSLHAEIRSDPQLLMRFIDETLRLHPPGFGVPRSTATDSRLGGAKIPAGAMVEARLDAANRDPTAFDAPTEVRLDRDTPHLSFGHGPHRCAGASLARQTIAAGLNAVLQKDGRLREAQPLSTLRWVESYEVHAPEYLWITWE